MAMDKLTESLLNMGYRRIDSNADGIYFFYRTQQEEVLVISVINIFTGTVFTTEQYEHILAQVKETFKSWQQKMHLLSLIVTDNPNQVKNLCLETKEDIHWVMDLRTNRLIIYENQSTDFYGMREEIESLLANTSQAGPRTTTIITGGKKKIFSLMNSIIIALNVIIFLITHYTKVFGGEDQMYLSGALSWYPVVREGQYYRLLTSMFMHADWNHLFNNMLVLIFLGDNLERAAGKWKYLFIYFGAGILAGITSIGYNMWKAGGSLNAESLVFSIGASGAIFGVVGAILYMVIINRGRLENIGTRQIAIFVVLTLYGGIANSSIDQAAHVGGFLAGLLLTAAIYRRPKRTNVI